MWKQTFNMSYTNPDEEDFRYQIFVETDKIIEEHNALFQEGLESFYAAHNKLSDYTEDELTLLFDLSEPTTGAFACFPQTRNLEPVDEELSPLAARAMVLPTLDYRQTEGMLSGVGDQGICASGYIFSALGALEAQFFKKYGKSVELSKQQVVDCGENGCGGGTPNYVYNFIVNNGITTEAIYSYEGHEQRCAGNQESPIAIISGYKVLTKRTEGEIMKLLTAVGPLSIVVDASDPSFSIYKGGVYHYSNCSSLGPNHSVLLVGYGTNPLGDYWIIKNSWGESWGINGFGYISRGSGDECGFAQTISYPVLAD